MDVAASCGGGQATRVVRDRANIVAGCVVPFEGTEGALEGRGG
jgi:hypothetical protein